MTDDYGALVSVAVPFKDIPKGNHHDFRGGILFTNGRVYIPLKHDDPDDTRYVELGDYIRAIATDQFAQEAADDE